MSRPDRDRVTYAVVLAALVLCTAATSQQRPFRHVQHAELACSGCHASGARHRSPRYWTPADCAACHHDAERALACSSCHEPGTYEPERGVPTTMALSVWDETQTRELQFGHARHVEVFDCRGCHEPTAADMLLTPPSCVACHSDHHIATANCAACHFPMGPEVHDLRVHLTCEGAGCHALPAERKPVLSRTFCVMCHTEQVDHEPGGLCHECHFMK
ncbi:MAG: hypothetical protein WEF86_16930 [Gemmatimonadota bacterium]